MDFAFFLTKISFPQRLDSSINNSFQTRQKRTYCIYLQLLVFIARVLTNVSHQPWQNQRKFRYKERNKTASRAVRYHSLSVVRNWGLSVNDCPSHFPVRQGKSIFSEKFPKDRFILIAESRFARNAEARPASRSPERERRFLFRARQLCRVASARKSGMFFLSFSLDVREITNESSSVPRTSKLC